MPVLLNSKYPGPERRAGLNWPRVDASANGPDGDSGRDVITIGLVNNMADTALAATALQFLTLLDAASPEIEVHLTLYSFPDVPHKPSGQRHIHSFYRSTASLFDGHQGPLPDGLIVTGREPLMADLREESYWKSFAQLLEWAREHTYATVWSCLAAHAAVLHMDGIGRIRSKDKHFGIFECDRVSDHPLTAGAAETVYFPHSRWNGLAEKELTAAGYEILTRTRDGESPAVDTFVKQGKSLFLCFQGHPEYGSDTLLREYRRDVGRFLKGEADAYPLLPRNYFNEKTSRVLTELRERAISSHSPEVLAEVSAALKKTSIQNTWTPSAALIYRNWLEYIAGRKFAGRKLTEQSPAEAVTA